MLRAALACLVLVACGPSSAEIRTAKEAHYTLPLDVVFAAVHDVAKASYGVIDGNAEEGWVMTDGQWYAPEGGVEPKTEGGQFVGDRSVFFQMEIHVRGTEGDWTIEVIPRAMQNISGSPQARELAPDDPAMPGWAHGRVDNMYVAIYDRLKAQQPKPAP